MSDARIPKPQHACGHYYVWQAASYGEWDYLADEPADIFSSRPTPSTPSGDFVGRVATACQALALLDQINDLSLDDARRVVAAAGEGA